MASKLNTRQAILVGTIQQVYQTKLKYSNHTVHLNHIAFNLKYRMRSKKKVVVKVRIVKIEYK